MLTIVAMLSVHSVWYGSGKATDEFKARCGGMNVEMLQFVSDYCRYSYKRTVYLLIALDNQQIKVILRTGSINYYVRMMHSILC